MHNQNRKKEKVKKYFLNLDIENEAAETQMQSFSRIYRIDRQNKTRKWIVGMIFLGIIFLFLPWTQNIRGRGSVTTLRQEERPMQVNSAIGGKVVEWYVAEGDFVQAGDTILQLGEVKVDYMDPQLLTRTQQQIASKQLSAEGYNNKAATATTQIGALSSGRSLKLQSLENKIAQQRLKLASDSMDLIAVNNQVKVYKRQLDAGQVMLDSGAVSLIDLEKRRVNYQDAFSKKISAENKVAQARQELIGLSIEQSSAIMEYTDKISKAEGDRLASLSTAASTNADVSKLENQYSNYDIRNKLYYVTAPQSGQITKAKKAGIGEILKEGEMLVEIVPDDIQYAVEMYIDPMDLPLVQKGQTVRFIFDGIPAIVFSGWPGSSYGTFGGKVTAVETNVSENGKFRILVAEDPTKKPWPRLLRMGGGADGIALLKDVPIYYEIWRRINGFPPDFYTVEKKDKQK